MRTCEEFQEQISGFLDDGLSPAERVELMAHLADCPACKACFDDLLAIHEAMAGERVPAPQGFARSVMAGLPQQEAKPRKTPLAARILAAAACLMFVFTGVWMMGGSREDPAMTKTARDVPAMQASTFAVGDEDENADITMALTVLSLESDGFTGRDEDCTQTGGDWFNDPSLVLVLYREDTQFPQGRPKEGDRTLVTGVPGDASDIDSIRAFRVEIPKQ